MFHSHFHEKFFETKFNMKESHNNTHPAHQAACTSFYSKTASQCHALNYEDLFLHVPSPRFQALSKWKQIWFPPSTLITEWTKTSTTTKQEIDKLEIRIK